MSSHGDGISQVSNKDELQALFFYVSLIDGESISGANIFGNIAWGICITLEKCITNANKSNKMVR